jgi:hypothetical protein
MSLNQEQRAARIRNLCLNTSIAIKNVHRAKIEEARDPMVAQLLSGLVLQVAEDARELIQEYGTNTHTYAQISVYEQLLRKALGI